MGKRLGSPFPKVNAVVVVCVESFCVISIINQKISAMFVILDLDFTPPGYVTMDIRSLQFGPKVFEYCTIRCRRVIRVVYAYRSRPGAI